jgi:hypothetical protein
MVENGERELETAVCVGHIVPYPPYPKFWCLAWDRKPTVLYATTFSDN